jgi:ssDNA-binding Zn-finger/Zn-ribbon topoisomerase 1
MTVIIVRCPSCSDVMVCEKNETMQHMYCSHCPACRDFKKEHLIKEISGPIRRMKGGGFEWVMEDGRTIKIHETFSQPSLDRVPRLQKWFAHTS